MNDYIKREDAMTVALQLGLNKWKPQFIKRKVMEIPSAIKPCDDAISREDAVEVAYAYCPDDDGSCTKGDRDIRELLDDLEALPSVATSRPQGEWIPCSERLPKEHGHYLCTVTRPQYIDRIYTVECYWCGRWYGWLHEEVTAWMPLPEPYKESE